MFLVIALLPAVILLIFIYFADKYQHEPLAEIFKAVGGGVVAGLLTLAVVLSLNIKFPATVAGSVADAFVNAGIPEEVFKLLMLWLICRSNRHFDEYFDGVVYAVCVGMGFAGLENILYLFGEENLMAVGIARGIISVPAHFLFAVAMGYYYSLAHFQRNVNTATRTYYKLCMIAIPVLLHGSFDALLMVASHTAENMNYTLAGACLIAFVAVCVAMGIFAFRKCRQLHAADKQYFDMIAQQQFQQYWN